MMRLTRPQALGALAFHLFAAAPVVLMFSATATTAQAQQQAAAQQQGNAQQQASLGPNGQPFAALTQEEFTRLQQILNAWEGQSKDTKTLECKFKVWHFDSFAAPAGVHATLGEGVIRYMAPDKGLFRVDRKVFYNGTKPDDGSGVQKPDYAEQPGQFGEHWVCNGKELLEFDRGNKECKIQQLPPNMQGTQIFNSPLPFVFNLDQRQIQERYWVREVPSPDAQTIMLEAWPKRQVDRAQYKVVQIALNTGTFTPVMLRLFAPNFDATLAPKWDHYQFDEVKRNSIGAGMQAFLRSFIDEKPPADFKVLRDMYQPPADEAEATAQAPGATQVR